MCTCCPAVRLSGCPAARYLISLSGCNPESASPQPGSCVHLEPEFSARDRLVPCLPSLGPDSPAAKISIAVSLAACLVVQRMVYTHVAGESCAKLWLFQRRMQRPSRASSITLVCVRVCACVCTWHGGMVAWCTYSVARTDQRRGAGGVPSGGPRQREGEVCPL